MKYLEKKPFSVGQYNPRTDQSDYHVKLGALVKACNCPNSWPELRPLQSVAKQHFVCKQCGKPWVKEAEKPKRSPFWRDPFTADS